MGNSESQPVRNMDKRTARREYRAQFEAGCNAYREEHADELCDETTDWSSEPIVVSGHSKRKIHVFARKRPIFQHEIDDGEFDCVTCLKGGITTVHDARMRNDMINQFMKHNEFKFHHSFSELDSNTTVYRGVASPLAQHAVLNGGHSTCMVYGQTGSGKTYTMTSVYEQACKEIFELVDEKKAAAEEDGKNVPQISVSVSFIEVAGEECHDLFNNFNTVQLAPGSDDSFHAYPIVEPVVTSAEECFALIMYGCGARATAATGVHDASSRSHAILRVYIRCGDGVGARNVVTEGVLTMVDLAGSEHRIDSMYHSAARRKEGAQINASLMTLKECIRAHGHNNAGHIYRKSALTKVLKGSFMLPNAVTHIIATVSPASKDTEHSLNTLRHACIMMNSKGKSTGGSNANSDAVEMEEETRFITGGHVYEVDLGRINIGAISKKNRDLKKQGLVPELKTSNGNKETSHGKSGKNNSYNHKVGAPSSSFGSEVNGGDKITATAAKMMSDELTEKEKIKMRKNNERAAFRKLTKEYRQCLVNARETIHDDSYYRQVDRMRGVYGIGGAPTPNVAVSDEVAAAEIRDRKKKQEPARKWMYGGMSAGADGARTEISSHSFINEGNNEKMEKKSLGRDGEDKSKLRLGDDKRSNKSPMSEWELQKIQEDEEEKRAQERDAAEAYAYILKQRENRQMAAKERAKLKKSECHSPDRMQAKNASGTSAVGNSANHNTPGLLTPSKDRPSIQTLYSTIYAESTKSVPESVLRRQLVTLLKLHGYQASEIEEVVPPSPTTLILGKDDYEYEDVGFDAVDDSVGSHRNISKKHTPSNTRDDMRPSSTASSSQVDSNIDRLNMKSNIDRLQRSSSAGLQMHASGSNNVNSTTERRGLGNEAGSGAAIGVQPSVRSPEVDAATKRKQQEDAANAYQLVLKQREERQRLAKMKLKNKELERIQKRDAIRAQQAAEKEREMQRQQQLRSQAQAQYTSERDDADVVHTQFRSDSPPIPTVAKRLQQDVIQSTASPVKHCNHEPDKDYSKHSREESDCVEETYADRTNAERPNGSSHSTRKPGRSRIQQSATEKSRTNPHVVPENLTGIEKAEYEVYQLKCQLDDKSLHDASRYGLQRQLKVKQALLAREQKALEKMGGNSNQSAGQVQLEAVANSPPQQHQQRRQVVANSPPQQHQQRRQAVANSPPQQHQQRRQAVTNSPPQQHQQQWDHEATSYEPSFAAQNAQGDTTDHQHNMRARAIKMARERYQGTTSSGMSGHHKEPTKRPSWNSDFADDSGGGVQPSRNSDRTEAASQGVPRDESYNHEYDDGFVKSTNPTPLQPQYRRGGHSMKNPYAGAAAAPFATDYSWDK